MYRIGYASDIHRLVKGRNLFLCGVKIPFELGLLGHSDADVALHSIAESILGALALGDLGKYFPPNDPQYENYDSCLIVNEVVAMMEKKGFEVNNIDVSIIAEQPHLQKYINEMRAVVATLLKIEIDKVSVKAGTNEGIGEIGKLEAIEARTIVLLRKKG